MYKVYFIKSKKNGKIYVGSTSKEVEIRLKEHNQGTNSWGRENGPFELVYYESYECKSDSLKREQFYKSGFGKQIKNLIVNFLEKKNIKPK